MPETTCWPTFEECPRCGEMTATDGTRTWCLECKWTDQPSLFTGKHAEK